MKKIMMKEKIIGPLIFFKSLKKDFAKQEPSLFFLSNISFSVQSVDGVSRAFFMLSLKGFLK